jgi:hypothetical protein
VARKLDSEFKLTPKSLEHAGTYIIAKIQASLSILFYEYWYSTGQSSLETRAPGVR